MSFVDNRVVLPYDRALIAAAALCFRICPQHEPLQRHPIAHHDPCLMPLLDAIDQRAADLPHLAEVSPDCLQGQPKCRACTGCAHQCHRHSQRDQQV